VIHIQVQYDAQTRTFKLVDREFNIILEGDALYDLAIPFTTEELEQKERMTRDSRTRLFSFTPRNSRN
jgi:hypothetical protein